MIIFPKRKKKMRIRKTSELGKLLRAQRKEQGLTQLQLAAMCNVGPRFIGELERGKPTVELEKALYVAHMLGVRIEAES